MKNRFWIYLFVFAVVVVIIIFWRRQPQQIAAPAPIQTAVRHTNATEAVASVPTQSGHNVSTQAISSAASPPKSDRERLPEFYQRYNEYHNAPIEFYGQMIDQNGNPVPGVNISVAISQTYMESPTNLAFIPKTFHVKRETGPDGRFEISNEKGDGFEIESIQKNGYRLAADAPRSFRPSVGNFENPVIFQMWKEGLKASLIAGIHVYGIDSGKTYTLNLLTGKKIEGETEGDLLVSITRSPNADPRTKFPWSFSIEAVQGGLVEAAPDDEFMYSAPESGYEPKIEMQFDPNDSNWTGVVKKRFFVRSRKGQIYGRAQVEIDSIYNVHSAIQIDYAINPNGSRNLQP